MLRQRTVREKASCTGVGLHSGIEITLEILPAPENNGITFVRTDMAPHAELKACVDHVADTTLATTLGAGLNGSRAVVGTVEHLLAALLGLGIDNARILVDGPEIPVLDGSAAPFIELLQSAGLESQRKLKRFLSIKKEVEVVDGEKMAKLSPGSGLSVRCTVDFDHPLISPTPYKFEFSERGFMRELARARTFGFLRDVEALRARGLALGGSLDNAVVIDQYQVLNPEGLRYPDEFVRHKVLDALGDMALFGMPIIGKLELHRSGHALNTRLVAAVLRDRKAYEIVEPAEADLELASKGAESRFPTFEPIENIA
ncbi:MAG: UDP-3-O-acyl-N-acetylglucosamine deacetylase [Myxococcota bacterium]